MPLDLNPPSSNSIWRLAQLFTEIRPASKRRDTRMGRSASRVQMQALSPYMLSFASFTASSSVSKLWRVSTGQCEIRIVDRIKNAVRPEHLVNKLEVRQVQHATWRD